MLQLKSSQMETEDAANRDGMVVPVPVVAVIPLIAQVNNCMIK